MSRCFPFPPPGYEKKHRPEDLDALKEAKLKEKKHKKEKKDKERRKDKEKREKDGSDEKYKDKKDKKRKHKDKKEKHREKKKEKNQGKDKEKSSISEESTVAGKLDEKSGEKPHPKEHSKDRISFVDEGTGSAPFQGQNGEKPFQNNLLSQGTEESKFVQDLDRRIRIRDDKMGTASQLLERVPCVEKRDQQTAAKSTAKNSSGVLADNKKDKRVQNNKMDVQGLRNEFSGNTMDQNFTGMAKSKGEGIPRPLEEHKEKRLEGKEKFKETGEKRTDKHKDRDKKSHGKKKEKEREKKKEKTKIKTENKKSEQDWTKDVGRSDLGFPNIKSTDLLKDANSSAVSEGNIRKRKDMDTNGFLHDSEVRPNKLLKADSLQLTENGRKLEACRPPSKSTTDKHEVLHSVQLDNGDLLVNGIIEPHKPSPSRPNTSIATTISNHIAEAPKGSHPDSKCFKEGFTLTKVKDHIAEAPKGSHLDSKCFKEGFTLTKVKDQIAEAKKRPPHPDSKYLNEVLTIPKVDDLSQINEQEWLFSRKDPSSKPKVESFGSNDEICVWSEAVHIESADVCALPYVVPY